MSNLIFFVVLLGIFFALCMIGSEIDNLNTTLKEKQIILKIADFNYDAALNKGSTLIIKECKDE